MDTTQSSVKSYLWVLWVHLQLKHSHYLSTGTVYVFTEKKPAETFWRKITDTQAVTYFTLFNPIPRLDNKWQNIKENHNHELNIQLSMKFNESHIEFSNYGTEKDFRNYVIQSLILQMGRQCARRWSKVYKAKPEN